MFNRENKKTVVCSTGKIKAVAFATINKNSRMFNRGKKKASTGK
jgi:hypothetical protein